MNNFEDKIYQCVDCKNDFVWDAGAQAFMYGLQKDGKLDRTDALGNHVQGEVTPPKRCEYCRSVKKAKYNK